MRARVVVIVILCASCAGALGQRGRRAPPGIAYCEPSAITVERGDGGAIELACHVDGRVSITDSDGFAATLAPDDAARLWDLIDEVGPLRSCAGAGPRYGPRYWIRLVGDDGAVEHASCPVGVDAAFDRVLGAVMDLRHHTPARPRWMDISIAVASR